MSRANVPASVTTKYAEKEMSPEKVTELKHILAAIGVHYIKHLEAENNKY